jgi:hypothetical protein
MVDAGELYLMVAAWWSSSLGLSRYSVIIA